MCSTLPLAAQLHACVSVRVLAVFGFATSEEADAVFHGPGGVALAEQVGVSRGADGGLAACADHREQAVAGDGAWGAGDQVGSGPAWNVVFTCCAVFRLLGWFRPVRP